MKMDRFAAVTFVLYLCLQSGSTGHCGACLCFYRADFIICSGESTVDVHHTLSTMDLRWVKELDVRNLVGVLDTSFYTVEKFPALTTIHLQGTICTSCEFRGERVTAFACSTDTEPNPAYDGDLQEKFTNGETISNTDSGENGYISTTSRLSHEEFQTTVKVLLKSIAHSTSSDPPTSVKRTVIPRIPGDISKRKPRVNINQEDISTTTPTTPQLQPGSVENPETVPTKFSIRYSLTNFTDFEDPEGGRMLAISVSISVVVFGIVVTAVCFFYWKRGAPCASARVSCKSRRSSRDSPRSPRVENISQLSSISASMGSIAEDSEEEVVFTAQSGATSASYRRSTSRSPSKFETVDKFPYSRKVIDPKTSSVQTGYFRPFASDLSLEDKEK